MRGGGGGSYRKFWSLDSEESRGCCSKVWITLLLSVRYWCLKLLKRLDIEKNDPQHGSRYVSSKWEGAKYCVIKGCMMFYMLFLLLFACLFVVVGGGGQL